MHGKTNFHMWRDFLQKYKIQTYYVGDFDNLFEDFISNLAHGWRTSYGSQFGNKYRNKQIQTIKTTQPIDWDLMVTEITNKYQEKIFILCDGSLEDYIGQIIGKDPNFEDIVHFCNNKFQKWYFTNSKRGIGKWNFSSGSNTYVNELDYFFHCITN